MVLDQEPPVGFLGPVVAAPPTEAEAVRLWDAVVALAAVPGVLEVSRPRPQPPEIPGCACHSHTHSVAQASSPAALTPSKEPVARPSGEHNWLISLTPSSAAVAWSQNSSMRSAVAEGEIKRFRVTDGSSETRDTRSLIRMDEAWCARRAFWRGGFARRPDGGGNGRA
jgi:hypothetical protein